ncbi:MAG: ABC transporter ATP-binding protein [Clostridiales bacterium]|nr:ABC transporter ATP-binding protein [Clostridiales bacterium]
MGGKKDREILIRTDGLTKVYGNTIVAVSKLNLEVRKGEIFGLLGPNGAGKTTTIRMLLGMTEPTAGKAFIGEYDCTRNPIDVKRMTGYLPDNVGFYGDMSGKENLRFTGRLNNIPEKELGEKIDSLLERVGIPDAGDQKVRTYSLGMKQRLGIADVLIKDPHIIILDEPTVGIDPEGVRQLIEIILKLSHEDGRTLLISSHQLYQMQQICDRVGIFFQGKLVACGSIEELASESGVEQGRTDILDEIYHRYFERREQ